MGGLFALWIILSLILLMVLIVAINIDEDKWLIYLFLGAMLFSMMQLFTTTLKILAKGVGEEKILMLPEYTIKNGDTIKVKYDFEFVEGKNVF